MRYAIIKNDVVENIIEADADYAQSIGAVRADTAAIGDLYNDGVFTTPKIQEEVPKIPESIAMWQARSALIDAGLLDDIDAFLANIPDATERKKAQVKWEFSNTVRRDDPLLAAVVVKMGITNQQLDALFIAAAAL